MTTNELINEVVNGADVRTVIDELLERSSHVTRSSVRFMPKDVQAKLKAASKKPISPDDKVEIDRGMGTITVPSRGGMFRKPPSIKADTRKIVMGLKSGQTW